LKDYNKSPKAEPHPLSQIPLLAISVILTIVTLSYNIFKNKKVKTVILRPGVTDVEYATLISKRDSIEVDSVKKEPTAGVTENASLNKKRETISGDKNKRKR